MLFDIDTSLLDTYGDQEGAALNYHYQDNGYPPIFAFDGLAGDLMKAELREGTQYCSKGAGAFMESLLDEFKEDSPSIPLYLRGDSGFASPELYEALEEKDCKYAIRLKENVTLAKRLVAIVLPAIGMPVRDAVELTGLCEKSMWTLKKQLREHPVSELMVIKSGGGRRGKTAGIEKQILDELEAGRNRNTLFSIPMQLQLLARAQKRGSIGASFADDTV